MALVRSVAALVAAIDTVVVPARTANARPVRPTARVGYVAAPLDTPWG